MPQRHVECSPQRAKGEFAMKYKIGSCAALAAIAAAGIITFSPSSARAQETRVYPVPSNVVTGGTAFLAGYVPSFIVAATSNRSGDKSLYVPVAGPWIDLFSRGGCGEISCGTEALYKSLLVVDGLVQGAGIVTALLPNQVDILRIGSTRISPSRIGYGGYGLTAAGHF
jgi:hypothetical protein